MSSPLEDLMAAMRRWENREPSISIPATLLKTAEAIAQQNSIKVKFEPVEGKFEWKSET